MFIIENITDIFLPIWTLWVRCAVWLIQANPIRSVWLILRVLSKKICEKFAESSIFCGILNPTILAFRMYAGGLILWYDLRLCHIKFYQYQYQYLFQIPVFELFTIVSREAKLQHGHHHHKPPWQASQGSMRDIKITITKSIYFEFRW